MTELSDKQVRRIASGCKDGTLLATRYFMGQLAEDDLRLREELERIKPLWEDDMKTLEAMTEGCDQALRERNTLRDQLEALREKLAEAERVRDGVLRELDEVDQRLGKALGYPLYYLKDGKVVGPDVEGAVKDGRVCTGDHVPGTLAAEAAGRIDALQEDLAAEKGANDGLGRHVWRLRDQLEQLREACIAHGDEHGTAFAICLLCSGAAAPAGDDVHAIVHEDNCPADPARARRERSE